MLRFSDFRVTTLQAALFLSDQKTFNASTFIGDVLGRYAERFDGPPQALPFPEDAPPEIPRVILQARNEQWRLHGSPARVDLFWAAASEDEVNPQLDEFIAPLREYVNKRTVRVDRLGFVLNHRLVCPDAARLLIKHFSNDNVIDGPLNRSDGFGVHNIKRYTLKDVDIRINSLVRCHAGLNEATNKEIVVIEQDINVVLGEMNNRRIDKNSIIRYFTAFYNEAMSVAKLYFPEA